jgi:hypothetical protein
VWEEYPDKAQRPGESWMKMMERTEPDRNAAKKKAQVRACRFAASDDLLEALRWAELHFRREGEDSNDHFERVAEAFHADTGYLRPGKDCRVNSDEDRQREFDRWMAEGKQRIRDAIARATA